MSARSASMTLPALPAATAASGGEERIDPRRLIAFVAMVFGMFMAILDIQIVSASLTEIQAGLAASAGEATRKLAENAVSVNVEKLQAGKIVKTVGREFLGDAPVLRLGKKSVRVEWVK